MWCDAAPAGPPRSRRSGYTLIEMMIVVVIMGVMITIAMPALSSPLRNQRLETAVQSLIGDFRVARTEAIRRNTTSFVVRVGGSSTTSYVIGYYPLCPPVGACASGTTNPVVVYTRTLQEKATFGSGTPTDTLKFTSFGTTTAMRTYTLQLEGRTRNVRVSAGGNAMGI